MRTDVRGILQSLGGIEDATWEGPAPQGLLSPPSSSPAPIGQDTPLSWTQPLPAATGGGELGGIRHGGSLQTEFDHFSLDLINNAEGREVALLI